LQGADGWYCTQPVGAGNITAPDLCIHNINDHAAALEAAAVLLAGAAGGGELYGMVRPSVQKAATTLRAHLLQVMKDEPPDSVGTGTGGKEIRHTSADGVGGTAEHAASMHRALAAADAVLRCRP
jgi:hypothetical protein